MIGINKLMRFELISLSWYLINQELHPQQSLGGLVSI